MFFHVGSWAQHGNERVKVYSIVHSTAFYDNLSPSQLVQRSCGRTPCWLDLPIDSVINYSLIHWSVNRGEVCVFAATLSRRRGRGLATTTSRSLRASVMRRETCVIVSKTWCRRPPTWRCTTGTRWTTRSPTRSVSRCTPAISYRLTSQRCALPRYYVTCSLYRYMCTCN